LTVKEQYQPSSTLLWLGLVGLLATGLRLALGWTSLTLLPATSDEASAALWAMHIADGARPLLFIAQPYQFPFESYLMSTYVDWMPHNALGARSQALILNAIAVGILIIAAMRLFPKGHRWPTGVLLALPSAYWLQHQSGYTPPQYSATAVFGALVILFVVQAWRSGKNSFWIFAAGMFGGLMLSNHMIGLSIVTGSLFALIPQKDAKRSLIALAAFAGGIGIGLIPYLAGEMTIPGANDAVNARVPLGYALKNVLNYALPETLPGVAGINPTLFTDVASHLGWPKVLRQAFVLTFLTGFGWILWLRLNVWIRAILKGEFPPAHPVDMFTVTTVSALVLLTLSARGEGRMYRFILPVAWALPFLVGYLTMQLNARPKQILKTGVILLAITNVTASAHMLYKWRQPGYLQQLADTPDLTPIFAYFRENNISHCYASFWFAYRFTYESNGDVVCAQPYNERFENWPVPFKDIVDQQENVPYVLTNTERAKFSASSLIIHLKTSGVSTKVSRIPPFSIFSKFGVRDFNQVENLSLADARLSATSNNTDALNAVRDGNAETLWSSNRVQQPGDAITVEFNQPERVQRVGLHYKVGQENHPGVLRIWGRKNGQWTHLLTRKHTWAKVHMHKGKPVHGLPRRDSWNWILPAQSVDAIKVEIVKQNYWRPWDLAELTIGVAPKSRQMRISRAGSPQTGSHQTVAQMPSNDAGEATVVD